MVGPILLLIALVLTALILMSIYSIGPTEVGLVRKRLGRKLPGDNPLALEGEAGYQADLLMPGLRIKFILVYAVSKHPWVQVPAGQIGVVLAQVGKPLPIGAKSAVYQSAFASFSDVRGFVKAGGQKGVQRPVLSPGTLAPIHPVAFVVITKPRVFGVPVAEELRDKRGSLSFATFGLTPEQLDVTRIEPKATESGKVLDMVGIITTLEGESLPAGDIASRLGGFDDIRQLEDAANAKGAVIGNETMIETILGSKNREHSAYQDFQTFLERGGRIGLQHDPLLYGAYNLNPFLVRVEKVPMLVVEQGQVAVIKSYVGLPTEDTSGKDFKFGSLVRPGHRGIWEEPLRTGKYPINPRVYQAELVQTEAFEHISRQLDAYEVETRGVYIQDVIYPPELVKVLTEREIANQEIETFKKQKDAQDQRVATEAATGKADMQKDLARSEVGITIADNNANAKSAEGRGLASYTKQTGVAQAEVIEAQGLARAAGFRAQNQAIGAAGTMAVNVATVLSDKKMQIVPQILVVGGGGGSLDALAATLTKMFAGQPQTGLATQQEPEEPAH